MVSLLLEEPRYFASSHININPSIRRIRTGSWHQADGPCHRAEELRTGKDQDVTNWQDPTFGHSLAGWVVCQTQVGLNHHCGKILHCWIGFKPFGLGFGLRSPGNAIGPIYFLGNCINPLPEWHLERGEEFEIWFVLACF